MSWTVVGEPVRRGGKTHVAARCACGAYHMVRLDVLKAGKSRSCASCAAKGNARALTHGETVGKWPTEYAIWAGMVQRCTNPNHPTWADYGGRGITICDRWRESYEAFVADMGRRPSKNHSIDRIDNDRGYEPGNCRWATRSEQRRNQRPHNRRTTP